MKIDFSQPILDLDGNETGLTLGAASIQSMINPVAGDDHMTAAEKVKLFGLSLKIHDGGEIDLEVEDIAFIKARIGKLFGPLVVGRAYSMLG